MRFAKTHKSAKIKLILKTFMTLNINDERAVRLKKMTDLREAGINPYPARVSRTHTTTEALAEAHGKEVTIAGRIMLKRDMGKLAFCHVMDEAGRMQVALKKDQLGDDNFKLFAKKVDAADIVQFSGERFETQKGEESIIVSEWKLLTKSLLPLPDKHAGLQDEELRMRKRYLEYIMNPDAKNKIGVRSKLVHELRTFMHEKGFMEVETPILETVASGAMAKTFDTYINAYNLPMHLRIAIELPQKRLMVGGFEKTFEIGRCFRNEGVDAQHNPEFTQIEYYWAYADYEDNMRLHEEMLPRIISAAIGTTKIDRDGTEIDFAGPYPRLTFRDAVLEHSGIDLNEHDTKESLAAVMKEKGYEVDPAAGFGKLADDLFKATARPKIIQPTFLQNYPAELKPLAKKAEDPRYTEMFQLVVDGFELSNSYTELNDPVDQMENFSQQADNKAAGDDEAMGVDHDFVEALEHGMPPATGTGIGIDRLAALITGAAALREVITFPLVKPEEDKKKKVTPVAHAVILDDAETPAWAKMNAAAHLSASFAARGGRALIHTEQSITNDGEVIPMNITHAIVMKAAEKREELLALKRAAEDQGLTVTCFTNEMAASSDDTKVDKAQSSKSAAEIEFLGVLIFGPRKQVEKLTADFERWSA